MRSLTPGEEFQKRYRIQRTLGEGGFGAVYEALDPTVGRRVALKVLHPDRVDGYSDTLRERFRREAAAVANLRDPHTVTLLDYGESDEGLLFLVFEFVDGVSLDVVLRGGPLEPAVAVEIARQILQSLREAHSMGTLHRDVKPANVIVYEYMGDPYRAKLVDFGLARHQFGRNENRVTTQGEVLGTARYVAPEIYLAREPSPATDLFGVGLVLYEMLIGRPANPLENSMEIATTQASASEFAIPETIPDTLRQLLRQLLRKKPEERFQSAQDVLMALQLVSPDSSGAGAGGMRELSMDDFSSGSVPPLELARPVRDPPPAAASTEKAPSATRRSAGGGVLRFAVVLTLVLAAVSAAIVWHFDIRMPWVPKPPPVDPATLSTRTFDLADPNTALFWVDWQRGIVMASDIREVPAAGRCVMLFDDREKPNPRGVFYWADALDNPGQKVEAQPVDRERLADRAALCDEGGATAAMVIDSADWMVAEVRLARAEAKRDRKNAGKDDLVVENATTGKKRKYDKNLRKKALELIIERGTGLPVGGLLQ